MKPTPAPLKSYNLCMIFSTSGMQYCHWRYHWYYMLLIPALTPNSPMTPLNDCLASGMQLPSVAECKANRLSCFCCRHGAGFAQVLYHKRNKALWAAYLSLGNHSHHPGAHILNSQDNTVWDYSRSYTDHEELWMSLKGYSYNCRLMWSLTMG